MKKRILSLLLAAVMIVSLLALASCGDDDSKPPIGGDTAGPAGDSGDAPADTDAPSETDPPETEPALEANGLDSKYFSDFVPDDNAKYTGKVGFGANKAGVDIDNFRVISADRKDIYNEEFEEITELNSAIFTEGNIADWTIGTDDTDEGNKNITSTAESKVFMGNTEWGPYRVNVKIKVADETETACVYFCVLDENNYSVLEVSTGSTVVKKITDGKAEVIDELGLGVTAGEWVATSVFLTYDTISFYVDGTELIRISDVESEEPLVTGNFGVGQWNTQFYVDNIQIVDIATGDVYYEQDFENADDFVAGCTFGNRNGGNYTAPADGDWVVKNEIAADGSEVANKVLSFEGATSVTGAICVFPEIDIPADCKGYKITMDAYRVAGSAANNEFYAIVWGYDSDTNYKNYNYGGWTGCGGLQDIVNGTKTNYQITNTIGFETGVWTPCEVYIYNNVVYSYFNGNLIQVYWID